MGDRKIPCKKLRTPNQQKQHNSALDNFTWDPRCLALIYLIVFFELFLAKKASSKVFVRIHFFHRSNMLKIVDVSKILIIIKLLITYE